MKIINNGNILGRFNLFDISVFLLVLLCVAAVFVKITAPNITSRLLYKEQKTKEVFITVALDEGMGWIFDELAVGDFQKGRRAEPIYEIIGKEFRSIEGDGKQIFVKLKVRAVIEPGGILSLRGSALKIGQYFFFDNEKIMFMGKIAKIEIP
jgi:hypothetical protein